jgi:hypothetical protein
MNRSAWERSRRGQFLKLLAAGIVAAVAGGQGAPGAQESPACAAAADMSSLRVIQGRITAVDGKLLTVKTPDGYPGGGPGIHAQFVTRGPEFRVDLTAGRVLEPDGRREDRQPLQVGERVVVLLSQPAQAGAEAANAVYAAAVVERVSTSDRMATH